MSRKALVTGITGLDGSYLAEWLIAHGYTVYGMVRRCSRPRLDNLQAILTSPSRDQLKLVTGDMTDQRSLDAIMVEVQPDEVYNLAANSFVADSWRVPLSVFDVNAAGTLRMLTAAMWSCDKPPRFYQASSSEMFGSTKPPHNEHSEFHPRSPYGVSKVAAHHALVNFRESYGMFACSGILFNHESPRRGHEFVTQKIATAVARIALGKQDRLLLGNVDAHRDWGFAGDYVQAMWLMLQQRDPDDYVIGTGKSYSVLECVQYAFEAAGLDWAGYVETDQSLCRPAEVDYLQADASKATSKLGWRAKTDFRTLIEMMVSAALVRERNS